MKFKCKVGKIENVLGHKLLSYGYKILNLGKIGNFECMKNRGNREIEGGNILDTRACFFLIYIKL